MPTLARTDTSLVGRWWWTIDKWVLSATGMLIFLGGIFILSASPAVAERIDLDAFHFARRQVLFLLFSVICIIFISFLEHKELRRFTLLLMAMSLFLMLLTITFGAETKGAKRWLTFMGFSIQASEFVKPAFAVLAAWLISSQKFDNKTPGYLIATILYLIIVGMFLAQPDVGMTLVISAIWGVQIFIAGLSLTWVMGVGILFFIISIGSYLSFDHVKIRVDRFLDPHAIEGFQVGQALKAFRNGGWLGRGPGEGQVKEDLPDAHSDFILAVIGEEFGLLACTLVVCLFLFIILRGFFKVIRNDNLFALLAVSGLLTQFAIQAIINMASTLNLMPPKGMTLPFVSYGGSSTLAMGITIGIVLALTRENSDKMRW